MPLDLPLIIMLATLAGVFGLIVGSFLNVVIWRVPTGESVVSPRSACPDCGHEIRARDNVPVLSWLLLKMRCRDCSTPISGRYPLVEAATGVFFVLVVLGWALRDDRFAIPQGTETTGGLAAHILVVLAFLYLAAVSVALTMIDIDVQRLPNVIVLPSIAVGAVLLAVASALAGEWGAIIRALIGAAALFAFYFVLLIVYPKGMGFGDVKLAALLGLYLGFIGWGALLVGAFAAFLLGGLYSIGLLIFRRAGRKTGIPFGPWMLLGAWVGIFFGERTASGYLALFGLN